MTFDLLHPRDQIAAIMARIYSRDMTTTSGGNISMLDEEGNVWISPARVDKGNLQRGDMVKLSPTGDKLEGAHPPSSEYPFHLKIYAARPDIKAVIHAHPGALVSFSICGKVPETRVFPEAWNICGRVAFAPYALPGSQQLGDRIAEQFAASVDTQCVILQNHGVVVGGTDLEDTFKRFETLEFTARTLIKASSLGTVSTLSEAQLELSLRSSAKLEVTPIQRLSIREKELRKQICDFIHRAYAHKLVTSTWGSLSARIDEESFVITPRQIDRQTLDIEDLVVVRGGGFSGAHLPSRAVRIHQAIYDRHPAIHAVINALPVHATAFSISDAKLETRTIPESFLFLKDVPCLDFEQVLIAPDGIEALPGPNHPVALIGHNGALVAGRSVLDAFDRLEVLEATAEALINSLPLGQVAPMNDSVIEELLAAFGQI